MIRKYSIFFLVISALPLACFDDIKEKCLNNLCAYKGARTFLFSYPRSGNTWTRYWLEYLTGRPSFHRFNLKDSMNHPIAWSADFEIDLCLPPIEKIHTRKEIEKVNGSYQNDQLILIIRNPKEALSRHGGMGITLEVLQGEGAKGNADPRIYFDNIAVYDAWNPEKRLLIYYEDLVLKPIQTIASMLLFLDCPLDNIDLFMAQYQWHKENALKIYKVSESKGEDLLHHSKKMEPAHRMRIDAWICQLYPAIWEKYLFSRYAERTLQYE